MSTVTGVIRLTEQLQVLLAGIAADPGRPLAELPLLPARERDQVLYEWNDSTHTLPDATVPELVAAQASRTPAATAVLDGSVSMSYVELNTWANRLAHKLVANGVGAGTYVAVALPRSAELIVALLAVLKAGAAYVPVEPDHPADRVAGMLDDARPVLTLDTVATVRDTDGWPDNDPAPAPRPGDPAYVIYTSGSTGRPKGVVVTHRSMVNYLTWATAVYPGLAGVAVLHSPVSFDLTVTTLYGPLLTGGTIRVADLTEDADSGPQCTFLKATPSHLALLDNVPADLSPTGELVVGGEQLLGEVAQEWRRANPSATVINEYGPTEATVGCMEYRIEPHAPLAAGPVPIGTPAWNTRLYIVDSRLSPAPIGVPGELYIAGECLAAGYLNRPGTDRRAVRGVPVRPGRCADVPHRRSREVARRRAAGVPRPRRRPGEGPWVPDRARRGRVDAVAPPRGDRGRGGGQGRPGHGHLRLVAYTVSAADHDGAAGLALPEPSRLHGAVGVRAAGRVAVDPQRKARPGGAARPGVGHGGRPRRATHAGRAGAGRGLVRGARGGPRSACGTTSSTWAATPSSASRWSSRARKAGLELTTKDLFRHQTIESLAPVVMPAATGHGRTPW